MQVRIEDCMLRHPEEFSDTGPRAREVCREVPRSKTEGERIEIAFEFTEFALPMAESGVRERYPQASEREIFLRCAARRI